jgi:hypothetical protein
MRWLQYHLDAEMIAQTYAIAFAAILIDGTE